MTLKQTFGSWTQASGWSTALGSIASGGNANSGQVDNSAQKSYSMEVSLAWGKDSAAGTGVIELWLLPEGNDGAAQRADVPPYGGRLIGVVTTAAEVTQRLQTFRINELPEKFEFYINNQSGAALETTTDVRYRFVDFSDV